MHMHLFQVIIRPASGEWAGAPLSVRQDDDPDF